MFTTPQPRKNNGVGIMQKSESRQENKAHKIFKKTNISYPLIYTRTCAYQRVRNDRFPENLWCLVFLLLSF